MDFLGLVALGADVRTHRRDILDGLVGELEILLQIGVVLDLHEDDGGGDEQRAEQEAPIGAELVHVRHAEGVDARRDGRARGLDALVKAGEVGELARVVGQAAHEPGW